MAAGPLPLGGTKIRTLLATLLLSPGRIVTADRLIDVIWDDDPPATARALIHTYVSGLRRAINTHAADAIQTRHPGYLVHVGEGVLDLRQFEALTARGRSAAAVGDHGEASEALRAAVALWRGPALDGVSSRALAAEATRLEEQRIAVLEERIAADLALGRSDALIGELRVLVDQHPARESLRGQLMLALHRTGRTAEALTAFRQGREALADELGIEPGIELCRLHEAILRADPSLLVAAGAGASAPRVAEPAPRERGPAQLPPSPIDFTGRETFVSRLVELSTGESTGTSIAVVAGPGGVGKSALAVHVAHRVAAAYPDGQLYIDLRGTSGAAASPAEALGRFLRAFQVDPVAIPDSVDERMDHYRTLLSDRRVLVILDDAASEQQVRPLLPGNPGCAVLVTSRSRLPGLAGAQHIQLDMLTPGEATRLLARVAGDDRISGAPDAAAQIVGYCGRLPLAVRIAGARLATRQQWSPQLLASRLADERQRLDELSGGDQQVRASIELSMRSLDPPAHTALRRLGQLGVSDFACWVVAALLDIDEAAAEAIVEQLVEAQLVDYTFVNDAGQVRYRLHDLVRIYAREQAERHESRADRVGVTTRVVTGWMSILERLSAHIVDRATSGAIHLHVSSSTNDTSDTAAAAALAHPRGWLDAEQASLVLAVERAAELDLDELAVGVASLLCASSYPLNNVQDLWDRAHGAALGAARRAGNAHGEAVLIAALGQRSYERDQYAEACRHLTEAVSMFRDLGHARGEAAALTALGLACREQGYLPEAHHFLAKAAPVCRTLGDDHAIGHCARIMGSVCLERGDFAAADAELEAALHAFRRAGSLRGEALTRRTIGLAHRARGRLAEAERELATALATFREIGDVRLEAFCLRALAKTLVRMGRLDEARAPLQTALAVERAGRDGWAEAMTLRTLGELDLAAGRLDDAERHLAAALAVFREQGAALFSARTMRDLARLLRARGEDAAALDTLTEAIQIFRVHGAREYRELIAELQTPYRESADGPTTLSR